MIILDKRAHAGTTPLGDVHVGCGFLFENRPYLLLSGPDAEERCMVWGFHSAVVSHLDVRTMVVPVCMEVHLVD